MPRTLPPTLLVLLLLTAQLLPPLPQYLNLAGSMGLGTTLAGAIIIYACWLYFALSRATPLLATLDFVLKYAMLAAFAIALVVAHSAVADAIAPANLARSFGSFIPLSSMMIGSMVLGEALCRASDETVALALKWSFRVLAGLTFLAVTRLEPLGSHFLKPAFPFTETSHFVLAFTPVVMYRCVQAEGRFRIGWLCGVLALGLVFQSLALLVGCLLIAVVCRLFLVAAGSAVLVMLAGLPLELGYFASRLDFSGSVLNLSNLVYVQGWQLVQESIVNTHGWGIGFQQLGLRGTNVPAAVLIRSIMSGDDANLTDGSFVFSKLASEFGIFGLIATLYYLVAAGKCIRKLRLSGSRSVETFAQCVVVSFGVDMFVRGPGYFVESTFLFIMATRVLASNRRSALAQKAIQSFVRRSTSAKRASLN